MLAFFYASKSGGDEKKNVEVEVEKGEEEEEEKIAENTIAYIGKQ